MTTAFSIIGVLIAAAMIALSTPPEYVIISLLCVIALNQGDSK